MRASWWIVRELAYDAPENRLLAKQATRR